MDVAQSETGHRAEVRRIVEATTPGRCGPVDRTSRGWHTQRLESQAGHIDVGQSVGADKLAPRRNQHAAGRRSIHGGPMGSPHEAGIQGDCAAGWIDQQFDGGAS